MNSFVPAARRPDDSGMTTYDSGAGGRRGSGPASQTPVFDRLVVEFREGFRSVPGDPWQSAPPPRFSELSGSGDRFTLPPGSL